MTTTLATVSVPVRLDVDTHAAAFSKAIKSHRGLKRFAQSNKQGALLVLMALAVLRCRLAELNQPPPCWAGARLREQASVARPRSLAARPR